MKKILLVDDDNDLLMVLAYLLKANGYLVTTLDQGADVIHTLDTAHPDLLILDINIGDYDGRDICREVKSIHAYDHIPVVLFSALVLKKEAMAGCQADAYIEKPVSTTSFLQTIGSLMAA